MNQAGLEVFGAVPGPAAAELALRSAERIDNEVQHTDSLLAEQMIAAGREHIVRRALHRRNHMEQIKQALGEW